MNGRPEPIDGVSLVPLFEGKTNERPVPIPFETLGRDRQQGLAGLAPHGPGRQSLQAADRHGRSGRIDLLFDLVRDPGETTNLAGQQPEVVRSMKGTLVEFRASCQRSLAGKDYQDTLHARQGRYSSQPARRRGQESGGEP